MTKKAKIITKENKEELKQLYSEFKENMGDVLGDTKEFVVKHKVLLAIGFIFYLLWRRQEFSVAKFVERLEEKIKGKAQEEDW